MESFFGDSSFFCTNYYFWERGKYDITTVNKKNQYTITVP
jgi:hypothetical protein